jgi:hypothetical protein
MKGWPGHRVRVLLLAILLGLGMSLSFVQGSVMAAEMAVSADAGHTGSSDCHGCGGSDDGGASASTCISVCGAAAHGLLSGEPVALPPASRASFEIASLAFGGRSHSPDHGPPKIPTLG